MSERPPDDAPPAGGFGAGEGASRGRGAPGFGPVRDAPSPSGGGARSALTALLTGVAVIGMLGTLAVLGIFFVRKYLAGSKTAEVKNVLGQMTKDATMAYYGTDPDASAGSTGNRLCPSASQPVPVDAASIRGKFYQSTIAEWEVDAPRGAGFACMRFSINQPQYYQYRYVATATTFEVGGRGDLNGNGRLSDFTIQGEVRDAQLIVAPSITEIDPEE